MVTLVFRRPFFLSSGDLLWARGSLYLVFGLFALFFLFFRFIVSLSATCGIQRQEESDRVPPQSFAADRRTNRTDGAADLPKLFAETRRKTYVSCRASGFLLRGPPNPELSDAGNLRLPGIAFVRLSQLYFSVARLTWPGRI